MGQQGYGRAPKQPTSLATLAPAGEEPHSGIVASITTGANPIVTCVEDERLEFQVCVSGQRQCQQGRQGIILTAIVFGSVAEVEDAPPSLPSGTSSQTWVVDTTFYNPFLFVQDGELVTFSEVVGMTQLNNHKPIRVKNCKVRHHMGCSSIAGGSSFVEKGVAGCCQQHG